MKASLPFKYITAVKNGKQYVVFDFKDKAGKRKRKWVGTNLPEKCAKKALRDKVDEIVADFDSQFIGKKPVDAGESNYSDQSISDFFTTWLNAMRTEVARTTHQGYRSKVKLFLGFLDEKYSHISLNEIDHNIVQEYFNYAHSRGAKGSTVRSLYLAIHTAFAYAVKMEYISVHPMDKLNVPRADKHEATFYNEEELNHLFEIFKDDSLELVVNIAAYYGLRRCEILGLNWDSIDFKNKTITIQRKVVYVTEDDGPSQIFIENRLKTNSTRRTLPLIPHIEKMLLAKKKQDEQCRKIYGKNYITEYDGYVCTKANGEIINPNYVTQHFAYVIKKHGLRHLRFHDLRHSCASLLLANDVPMKAIQEWLGHSNFSITANLYSHLEYNAKIASAETIAKVLGKKGQDNNSEKEQRITPE